MSLHSLRTLIQKQSVIRAFELPGSAPREAPPSPPPGYALKLFGSPREVPPEIARRVMPFGPVDLLRCRMRRGLARLMVLLDDHGELAAHGWIQSWRPFRRRLACLGSRGRMLGPYVTQPAHRGRGLYHFLLRESVALAEPGEPLYIYAETWNEASLRGIQKAGFRARMDLRLRRFLCLLYFVTPIATFAPP